MWHFFPHFLSLGQKGQFIFTDTESDLNNLCYRKNLSLD